MKKILTSFIVLLLVTNYAHAQTWGSVGGSAGFNGQILCLLTDNTNHALYAGGAFTAVDGTTVNGIAKWNGTSWSAMGSGFTSANAVVYALEIYNNELYAGGYFTTSGSTTVNNIAKWNGSAWVPVGGGMSTTGSYDFVFALKTFNNELYAGGKFTTAGGNNAENIAKWNGTAWAEVAGGTQDRVNTLYVHNNELYAGGNFVINNVSFNLQYRIAKLSGNNWVNVGVKGLGDATMLWGTYGLATYNSKLYAGGYFNVLESGTTVANHMAMWDGSAWSTVGTGTNAGVTSTSINAPVRVLKVYDNKLYAGGTFTAAGGTAASNVAYWNGTGWNAVATGTSGQVQAMEVFDGSLIIAGNFNSAGGSTRNNVAKLTAPAGINDVSRKNYPSVVAPNPSTGDATVKIDGANLVQAQLHVYDMSGRLVQQAVVTHGKDIVIHRKGLAAGTYTYAVSDEGSIVADGKVVFE